MNIAEAKKRLGRGSLWAMQVLTRIWGAGSTVQSMVKFRNLVNIRITVCLVDV